MTAPMILTITLLASCLFMAIRDKHKAIMFMIMSIVALLFFGMAIINFKGIPLNFSEMKDEKIYTISRSFQEKNFSRNNKWLVEFSDQEGKFFFIDSEQPLKEGDKIIKEGRGFYKISSPNIPSATTNPDS